jgi:hypothetical protein
MTKERRDEPEGKQEKPNYTPRKAIEIPSKTDDAEGRGRAYAEFMTGGPLAALRIIRASEKSAGYVAEMDFPALLATLREQGGAVNAGNLGQAEAMLMNQATALQTVFARLVERGMNCTEIPAFEMNLRMGLRAQSQCRATIETLAAIKNPTSVAFVRQANIAHGPQQVNNASAAQPEASRAREIENEQSKLSQTGNELLPNTGAPAVAGCIDSPLEAVGEINRPENASR